VAGIIFIQSLINILTACLSWRKHALQISPHDALATERGSIRERIDGVEEAGLGGRDGVRPSVRDGALGARSIGTDAHG
jgi:hypothetical protein